MCCTSVINVLYPLALSFGAIPWRYPLVLSLGVIHSSIPEVHRLSINMLILFLATTGINTFLSCKIARTPLMGGCVMMVV